MERWKRLLFYLVLNVLVSACTVVTVLVLWDRFRPLESATPEPQALREPTLTFVLQPTATPPPSPPPTPVLQAYEVQTGDTLGSIAEEFDVDIETLMTVNGLEDANTLGSGQVLFIPITPMPPTPTEPATGPSPLATVTPSASGGDPQVEIVAVVGAGALPDERVVIRHAGEGELSMLGWRLESGSGASYTFPQLTLFKDGAVSVYTRAGSNNVVELYWGRTEPVWQVGETVLLYDPEGNVRDTYRVP